MERRRYLRGLAAAGVVSVAGCTSDDSENGSGNGDSGSGDTDTPAVTATEGGMDTPTETEADTPTETEAASTETPPSDPDQRVAVGDGFNFDPESFEISVGDTVLWEWVGSGHNVAYDEGNVPAETDWEGDDDSLYSEGHFHAHTFEVAGEYEYYCQPHRSSGMVGNFTVTE
jgi:plastocyanin